MRARIGSLCSIAQLDAYEADTHFATFIRGAFVYVIIGISNECHSVSYQDLALFPTILDIQELGTPL